MQDNDEQLILKRDAQILWAHNELTKEFRKDLEGKWKVSMTFLCKESNNLTEQQIRFKLGECSSLLKVLESINYGNG